MIVDLQRQVAALAGELKTERAITLALMAQYGDPTHISIKRAAELRGCSVKTIRRKIDAGEFTLEQIPGAPGKGIPIEQLYSKWTPVSTVRQAIARERAAGGGTLKTRHGETR